ncbi:hypothetical protein HS125_13030 [bacterium]|nr:hypothetical protein [bacterium]
MEILEARFNFYYELHRRALEAAGDLVDIVHVGEDLGNQRAPMIGPEMFERLFAPKLESSSSMVHSHGAKP